MSDIDKKYYIPKEEEFCIGFEFEYYNSHVKEYVKAVADAANFSLNDLDGSYDEDYLLSENCSNPNKIRVKYLDREDVESLGFTHLIDDCYNLPIKEFRGRLNQEVRVLIKDTIMIYLALELGENMPKVLFTGWLKNKSEFYKILKQLGIK
jgi:hypothetical protein